MSSVRLCAPSFGGEDLARVRRVLDSGMLVQGEMVGLFEAGLAEALGVEPSAVLACSSGTAALHLAMMALGVGPGDEVIVPAFTWPSAAHAVVQTGAEPVFVDIDPETLNLAPALLPERSGERTRAIVPIHQFGIPAPMTEVLAFAQPRGLWVVEDAACAIGVECDGGLAGTLGDLGCFSFHPRKVVTTGEGGAVVARGDRAGVVSALRNHGQDPEGGLERFVAAGLNYRMPELSAAIGIGQLAALSSILHARRRLAALYVHLLDGVDGVHVPAGVRDPRGNAQSFVVRVAAEHRDELVRRCGADDVQTTIGTYAVVSQPVFRARGVDPAEFPASVTASRELITLPLHPGMSDSDVERVVSVVDENLRNL